MKILSRADFTEISFYLNFQIKSELEFSDNKSTCFSSVSDNRDFDALNWWAPARISKIQDLKTRSFTDLEHYVRFRTGCLEVLQGAEKDIQQLEKLAEVPDFEDSEVVLLSGYHRMYKN